MILILLLQIESFTIFTIISDEAGILDRKWRAATPSWWGNRVTRQRWGRAKRAQDCTDLARLLGSTRCCQTQTHHERTRATASGGGAPEECHQGRQEGGMWYQSCPGHWEHGTHWKDTDENKKNIKRTFIQGVRHALGRWLKKLGLRLAGWKTDCVGQLFYKQGPCYSPALILGDDVCICPLG